LRLQAKLKEERAKLAVIDQKEAEVLAERLSGLTLTTEVKVDPEGHMYGSVGILDIVRLFEKEGVQLEKRNIVLAHPIKALGVHTINLKLKEGVPAAITLQILNEHPLQEQE
jgi:large subunit ribosomal protein L9